MLNFMIEVWNRIGSWKTSSIGAAAGVVVLAQWFGYVNIPEVAGVVALAEALALFGAKDS